MKMSQVLLILFLAGLVSPSGQAEACTGIRMRTFSVCIPNGWYLEKHPSLDQVASCNIKSGDCTGNGGGFPLRGAIFIALSPIDHLPQREAYHTAEDIALDAARSEGDNVTIQAIHLRDNVGISECYLSRDLMFGKVWNDVYGMRIGNTLFRVWVQYNNEQSHVNRWRETIIDILSSVALKN